MRLKTLINIKKFEYNWEVIEQIPEFAILKECEQSPKWHAEGNVWNHTVNVCNEAIKICKEYGWENESTYSSLLLGSALFHDIGKGVTTEFKKGGWHAYGHEIASEKLVRELLWDEECEIREGICGLVRWHMEPLRIFEHKDYLEWIVSLSKNVQSWYLLLALKKCDILGSIQEDEISKKNDLIKLEDISKIVSSMNCFYTNSRIAYKHQLNHKLSCNGKKNINVHVLIGLPGAGKSTAIKEITNNDKIPYTIVSRDIARAELGFCKKDEKIVGTRQQEDEVSAYCDKLMLDAAYFGDTIIIDNINLKKKYRDYYKELLKEFNVNWIYHYVEASSLETNIKRREGQIDRNVFINMIKSFEWPNASEYDRLIYHFN